MIEKPLRYTRIAVSLLIFIVLTLSLTSAALSVPQLRPLLEKIQLGPAIISLSIFPFVAWLIITLIFGRVYCSSVCPLGTLQDVAARASRIGRRRTRKPFRYEPPVNTLRITSLLIMLLSLMSGFMLLTSILDPYCAFNRICDGFFKPVLQLVVNMLAGIGIYSMPAAKIVTATAGASIIATFLFMAIVMTASRTGRTLCNTICPIGTTLGFVSRVSIFQIDIDTDKCIQCRRCEDVCKASCIDLTDHVVDGSRCVNCFNCINVCPNDAIHYTANRKRLATPMMQRITEPGKQTAAADASGTCQYSDNTEKDTKSINDETIS